MMTIQDLMSLNLGNMLEIQIKKELKILLRKNKKKLDTLYIIWYKGFIKRN